MKRTDEVDKGGAVVNGRRGRRRVRSIPIASLVVSSCGVGFFAGRWRGGRGGEGVRGAAKDGQPAE
jgi:hypothetical protein